MHGLAICVGDERRRKTAVLIVVVVQSQHDPLHVVLALLLVRFAHPDVVSDRQACQDRQARTAQQCGDPQFAKGQQSDRCADDGDYSPATKREERNKHRRTEPDETHDHLVSGP